MSIPYIDGINEEMGMRDFRIKVGYHQAHIDTACLEAKQGQNIEQSLDYFNGLNFFISFIKSYDEMIVRLLPCRAPQPLVPQDYVTKKPEIIEALRSDP